MEDSGDGVGVGDDLEDPHADATCSAAGDALREDAGEELCPADAPGSGRGRGRGFGRVAGEGEVQRELWRRRCGGPGDDALAQAMNFEKPPPRQQKPKAAMHASIAR